MTRQHTPIRTVGLLSMQRVANYGSFLQAYALRKLLEAQGAEVHFIDIEPGIQLKGYETRGPMARIRALQRIGRLTATGKLMARIRGRHFLRTINDKFRNDYQPLLGLDRPAPSRYDLAVIGSDEVFHCCQRSAWGFTPQLYGKVAGASQVISYAASFGSTTYSELRKLGLTDTIADAFCRLSAISVRDDNSEEIVERITGRKPLRHLDPVLVYGFSEEPANYRIPKTGYLLVYSYQTRIWNRNEIEAVKRFARTHGKRIISIFCQYDWCDEAIIPEPFEVLAYFKAADFVVTETFHGTIFSIITHSRFCTLLRDSNREKLTSLLKDLKLEQRILSVPGNIDRLLSQPIDYSETDKVIERERLRTAEYLSDHISVSGSL